MRRWVATAAAAVLFGTVVAVPSPSAFARADDFYAPPVPLRAAAPGRVIRSEPIAAPAGARAWRVLYHSRSLAGADIAVSGVVVAPEGPSRRGGRPVVAWAHGTTGVGDACAPSKSPTAVSGIPWIADFLAAGYVVAATDYEGLGTPGIHPYLVGESEGRSVLDAARAARRLPTGASREVVVAGHSQGGHAALFAGEIAKAYAPGLAMRGVVAGAPVSDVPGFLDWATRRLGLAGFLLMGASGYRTAYPELATQPMLSSAWEARREAAERICVPEVITAFDDPPILAGTAEVAPSGAWARRLAENSAGRRPAGAPVLLVQGDADDLTPEALNAGYVPRACASGSIVDYRVYPGADHVGVLGAARSDLLAFVAARFAGTVPTDGCPR